MEALISAKGTFKKMSTNLKCVAISAMNEASGNVTYYMIYHLILSNDPVQMIRRQFVNKTRNFSHEKNLLI